MAKSVIVVTCRNKPLRFLTLSLLLFLICGVVWRRRGFRPPNIRFLASLVEILNFYWLSSLCFDYSSFFISKTLFLRSSLPLFQNFIKLFGTAVHHLNLLVNLSKFTRGLILICLALIKRALLLMLLLQS